MLRIIPNEMPFELKKAYDEFDKENPAYSATVHNWSKGQLGCFLSHIFVCTPNGDELLITTRNLDSNQSQKKPCSIELGSIKVIPKNKDLNNWLNPCSDEEYKNELIEFITSSRETYSFSVFSERYFKFLEFIETKYPYLLKQLEDITNIN